VPIDHVFYVYVFPLMHQLILRGIRYQIIFCVSANIFAVLSRRNHALNSSFLSDLFVLSQHSCSLRMLDDQYSDDCDVNHRSRSLAGNSSSAFLIKISL
jgi:hypothetical protein